MYLLEIEEVPGGWKEFNLFLFIWSRRGL